MVDDLSFATTFEAGKLAPIDPRPLNLTSLLLQTTEAVNATELKGGRTVTIKMHTSGVPVEYEDMLVDPRISRVVYSLLSNAVRYSPATDHSVDFTVTYTPIVGSETGYTNNGDVGSKRGRDESRDEVMKFGKTEEGKNELPSTGSFKFTVRNSTVTPINLSLVRNYFRYYYHFDALAPGEISITDENKSIMDFMKTTGTITTTETYINTSIGLGGDHITNSSSYKDLTSTKGLGLGLYTAYNMVKIMGGELQCSAENHNEAVFTFTLSLPLTRSPTGDGLVYPTASITPRPSTQQVTIPKQPLVVEDAQKSADWENVKMIRVLVVDDSSLCQKVIVKSLKGLEFITDVASNGLEACDKLTEKPCKYDVVLMDIRMPIMGELYIYILSKSIYITYIYIYKYRLFMVGIPLQTKSMVMLYILGLYVYNLCICDLHVYL